MGAPSKLSEGSFPSLCTCGCLQAAGPQCEVLRLASPIPGTQGLGWVSLPTRSSLHISQLEGFCKTGVPGLHPKVWFVLGWAWTLGLLKISQETHLQPGWRTSAPEAGDAGLLVVKAEGPSSVQKTPC